MAGAWVELDRGGLTPDTPVPVSRRTLPGRIWYCGVWSWCSRSCSGSPKPPHTGLWRGGTPSGALRQMLSWGHTFPIPEGYPACLLQPKTPCPSACTPLPRSAPFMPRASVFPPGRKHDDRPPPLLFLQLFLYQNILLSSFILAPSCVKAL